MQITFTVNTLHEAQCLLGSLRQGDSVEASMEEFNRDAPKVQLDIQRSKQGKYVGILRHLPPSLRNKVKKVRREKGLEASLDFAALLKNKPKPKDKPKRKTKHHWRKTCVWCTRGYLSPRSHSRFCSKPCRDASSHAAIKAKRGSENATA